MPSPEEHRPLPSHDETVPVVDAGVSGTPQVSAGGRRCCTSCRLLPGPSYMIAIILNEACERFAFYSARAILIFYLTDALGYSEAEGVSFYSYFMAAAYFAPLLGGYVSDVWLGKFGTIASFNIVYIAGITTLAATAFSPSRVGAFLGLALIALGTGGLKPCISPFGAEQLGSCTAAENTSFFFTFYASINLGSTFSYILTPILRSKAGFGPAFMLAAAFVFLSAIIFVLPARAYVRKAPAGTSVWGSFGRVLHAWMFRAPRPRGALEGAAAGVVESTPLISAGASSGGRGAAAAAAAAESSSSGGSVLVSPMELTSGVSDDGEGLNKQPSPVLHSPRPAMARPRSCCRCLSTVDAPAEDVVGVAAVLRVMPLFSLLPVFWALFDAQGSVWSLQRSHMENCIGSGVCLTPEQLGALNPILVLIFVPFFDSLVFPCLRSRAPAWAQPTALKRMTVGMQVTALSFGFTYMVEVMINSHPEKTVSVLWQLPQFVVITFAEILVSATGLEWAYSQSPPAMRGSIVALYLTMVAIGNLLTGAIYNGFSDILSTAQLILLLAGLMVVAGVVFAIQAIRFVPDDSAESDATESDSLGSTTVKAKLLETEESAVPGGMLEVKG